MLATGPVYGLIRTAIHLIPFSLMMFPTIYIYHLIIKETDQRTAAQIVKKRCNFLSARSISLFLSSLHSLSLNILRQSLTLIMLTILTGFSQFVINILLPYTNTETRLVRLDVLRSLLTIIPRLLITSVIDQFALIFESLEILFVFRVHM